MSRTADAAGSAYVQRMRALDVFAECSDEEIDALDGVITEVRLAAGRELLHEGAVGRQFAVIAEGVASVTSAGEEVARLTPGDFFGEMSLLSGNQVSASVLSVTPMRLYVFNPAEFRRMLDRLPTVARVVREQERLRSAMNDIAGATPTGG